MKKITPSEFNRRMNKLKVDGMVGLRGARRGDVINVLTEPATYSFQVVDDPISQLVEITSLQDPDFFGTRVCLFLGSVWDNVEIENWDQVPMKVFGCLLKDCYPVINLSGRLIVLPRIYEVEIGGKPFFKTTSTPNLLEDCI